MIIGRDRPEPARPRGVHRLGEPTVGEPPAAEVDQRQMNTSVHDAILPPTHYMQSSAHAQTG